METPQGSTMVAVAMLFMLGISFLIRMSELYAFRFEPLAECFQILYFKSDVIHGAACGGDVSDGLIAFPAEEVQAVTDAGQVGADEEVGLSRTQSRIEGLHVPLLHFDVLLVDEMNVMGHDRRRVFLITLLIAGDELDFRSIGADKIRESSIHSRGSRGRGLAARPASAPAL